MTESVSNKPFGEPGYANRPPEKKRGIGRYILFGVLFLVLLGIGTCTWTMIKMFGQASEMQPVTRALVERTLKEGFPDNDDEIWHEDVELEEETLSKINRLMAAAGPAESIGDAVCGVNSYAGNRGRNGTFATCVVDIEYAKTTGNMEITWQRDDEKWMLLNYRTNYNDITELMNAEAANPNESSPP